MKSLTKIELGLCYICLLLICTFAFSSSVKGQCVDCDGDPVSYQALIEDLPEGFYESMYCWYDGNDSLLFCCCTIMEVDKRSRTKNVKLSCGIRVPLVDGVIFPPDSLSALFFELTINDQLFSPKMEILWANRATTSKSVTGDIFTYFGRALITDNRNPGSGAVDIVGRSGSARAVLYPSNLGGVGLEMISTSLGSSIGFLNSTTGDTNSFLDDDGISLFSANFRVANFTAQGLSFGNGTKFTPNSIRIFGGLEMLDSVGTTIAIIDSGRASFGTGHTNTGENSFVAGKDATATGLQSTVGGGLGCTASGNRSVVAGGHNNSAEHVTSAVLGGYENHATGQDAVIGGGIFNTASGGRSFIGGGEFNTAAGNYSFAAGKRAKAMHTGSFVWSDNTGTDFASTAANQFNVRSIGGVRFATDSTFGTGVTLAAGASAWAAVSDSTLKRNIREVDGEEILDRLAELPVSRWSYKSQSENIEHIGPMAQDFYRLFGLGEDDKHITTLDPDGIALAAIKALIKKNNTLEGEMTELRNLVEKLIATHN